MSSPEFPSTLSGGTWGRVRLPRLCNSSYPKALFSDRVITEAPTPTPRPAELQSIVNGEFGACPTLHLRGSPRLACARALRARRTLQALELGLTLRDRQVILERALEADAVAEVV